MGAPTTAIPLSNPSSPPAVIAIPGASPTRTNRRSATNPLARLSAYVVRDANLQDAPLVAIKVVIESRSRLLGVFLSGHHAPIVDLEFLPTSSENRVHVLGSCDQDGIVYLWFLYVEKDPLGIDKSLKLLRDYSFYSLRKSTSAFYSRIRLAGSPENGTMVLVPNDGSNVRVVTFHCEPNDDPNAKPNVPVIAPPPEVKALPAPQHTEFTDDPVPDAPPAPDVPSMPQDMGVTEDEEFVDALDAVVPPPQGERPIDVARATEQGGIDDPLPLQPSVDEIADEHVADEVITEQVLSEQPADIDDYADAPEHDPEGFTNGHAPVPA